MYGAAIFAANMLRKAILRAACNKLFSFSLVDTHFLNDWLN